MAQGRKVVAQNRRATHDYFIEERLEAGLALTGSEVKSLRTGKASLGESYAGESKGSFISSMLTFPSTAPRTALAMSRGGLASFWSTA